MPRQGHSKSRYGCLECKRRRVKCDETHPVCTRCAKGRRPCSYSLFAPSLPNSTIATVSTSTDNESLPSLCGPSSISVSSSLSGIPPPRMDTPYSPSDNDRSPSPGPGGLPADLTQLECLHHFTTACDMGVMGSMSVDNSEQLTRKLVEEGLSCDFLMNQILAISARHLAHVRPGRSAFYMKQARQFQTHALRLFTRAHITPSADNCLGILFFSWMLGTHQLSDLSTAPDDVVFLEEFHRYLDVYRGTRTVVSGTWGFLKETELPTIRAMFQDGEVLSMQFGNGPETRPLRDLIQKSLGMGKLESAAAEDATARIQAVIDAKDEVFTMVFTWPLIIDQEFVASARRRRPESLLVLAHFAVLLHWCRESWVCGQVGARLLRSVEFALGPGWERWLQWPKEVIETDAPQTAINVEMQ